MKHSKQAAAINHPNLGLAILVVLLVVSTACQPTSSVPASTATPSVVQIGPFRLTHAPTLQELRLSGAPLPTPQEAPNPDEAASVQEVEVTTLAEVRKLAGFDVWSPAYLPSGYTLQRYTVLVGKDAPAQEVSAEYISADYKQLWYLRQIPYSAKDANNAFDFPVGNARVVTVTVRGQPGVWVEATNQGARQTEAGEEILVPWNMLLWVEGDYFFWLYSSELPLEENLKVAESLTEATR